MFQRRYDRWCSKPGGTPNGTPSTSRQIGQQVGRAKLKSSKAHGDVYWVPVEPGVALGYYKPSSGVSGTWWVRRKIAGRMLKERVGVADDYADADGMKLLDYGQAQRAALAQERAATVRATEGGFTVGDALDLWLAHYQTGARSPTAVRETGHKVKAVRSALGDQKVIELTAAAIKGWMSRQVNTGRTVRAAKGERKVISAPEDADPKEVKRRRQATANRLLAALKAALNYAWQEGKVTSDTEWRRVKPFKGADQPRMGYLTVDQAIRLINSSERGFRPLVRAAVLTGCRWGELREMRVHQYKPGAKTVAVVHTKGGRDRQVPLTDEGVAFFGEVTVRRPSNALMFERSDKVPWGPQDQKRPMAAGCVKAKIVPAVGFHALRHTYGSLLAMEGVPLHVIAQAMGHRDNRMTERHYAHLAPGYVADTIRENLPSFDGTKRSEVSDLAKKRAERAKVRRVSRVSDSGR